MNSKQLECFIEVAETLNFTVAANNLFLSQPSVTHQIKTLENELGVRLFTRTKHAVRLTKAGQNFYVDAKEILSRMLIAKQNVSQSQATPLQKIAIGYTNTALEQVILPALLAEFSKQFPETYVFLKQFNYKELITNLEKRKMDVIFTYSEEALLQDQFIFEKIITTPYYFVLAKQHVLAQKTSLKLTDLRQQTLILPEISSCPKEAKKLTTYLATFFPTQQIYYCDTPQTAKILAQSGLGIAVLPGFEVIDLSHCQVIKADLNDHLSYGIGYLKQTNLAKRYYRQMLLLAQKLITKELN